jgi:Domain of unknown function (DUF4136)
MRFQASAVLFCAMFLTGAAVPVFADNVRTDYNHQINFAQYHTYTWGNVKTSDPFFVDRIKAAVDKQLQAKGWQLVASGASVTIFATDNVHNQKEAETLYSGFGGGWGGGWGWGGWGWGLGNPGGFGDATTTTFKQSVANLVIDLFDGNSKNLLWRGLATQDLSSNANKNTKSLDSDIARMFKGFPPK